MTPTDLMLSMNAVIIITRSNICTKINHTDFITNSWELLIIIVLILIILYDGERLLTQLIGPMAHGLIGSALTSHTHTAHGSIPGKDGNIGCVSLHLLSRSPSKQLKPAKPGAMILKLLTLTWLQMKPPSLWAR